MGAMNAPLAALAANGAHRAQAQAQAEELWRDVVLQRLTIRALDPLDAEERRYLNALRLFDETIARARRRLDE
jgi:hypothetical protein